MLTLVLSWPGVQKPLDQYGPESSGQPPAAKGGADDEDDFDLFGSEVCGLIVTCTCTCRTL